MRIKYYKLPYVDRSLKLKLKTSLAYIYSYSQIGHIITFIHSLISKKWNFKYKVSICLIFKDEAPFLKEWIEYHLLIGVDHFYLFNNNSTDNYKEILAPYQDKGIITLIEWPKLYSQSEAYKYCHKIASRETQWLGFIDIDEFVNLNVLFGNDIKLLLNKYNSYPGINLYWRIFGTSGLSKENYSKPVIEQYTQCWPWLVNVGKCFINNNWNFKFIWHHYSKAKFLGLTIFLVNDEKIFTPYSEVIPLTNYNPKIYINHYYTKSVESFKYKIYHKTDVLSRKNEDLKRKNEINYYEQNCSCRDFSIQRWLFALKERL